MTEMTVDVLVLGSGVGGLVAALTAKELGLQAVVVEKSARLGGSSAMSGGGIWLPCNPLIESAGVTDTPDLARQYLAAVVGDAGPSASPERQAAFVEGARDIWTFLQRRRVRSLKSSANRYPVWTESVAAEPVVENGRIVAMTVMRAGEATLVRVKRGVLIATGGFARNAKMREQYSPRPVAAAWTLANMGDQGDGIELGMSIGGATALMDEAWWMPVMHMPPDGRMTFVQYERSLPGSIMVDSAGKRFFNEAVPYMEVGKRILEHHVDVPAVPCWLIFDRTYRRRYAFGARPPWITPRSWTKSGIVKTAGSISELATQCGIDANGLNETVARFNEFARAGRDDDFHRGEVAYDLHNGDSTNKPNPCLAPLARAPFYAVAIYPGDVGTCGGLLTDQHARVFTDSGAPIAGLYATGNAAAPVSGTVYPGAGMSIAASMIFGRRAVQHMATLEQLNLDPPSR